MFVVLCVIGNKEVVKCMLDLGVSINVMFRFIYVFFNFRLLKFIRIVIYLADRFFVYSEGVIKDVLVKVIELVFFADFYVVCSVVCIIN